MSFILMFLWLLYCRCSCSWCLQWWFATVAKTIESHWSHFPMVPLSPWHVRSPIHQSHCTGWSISIWLNIWFYSDPFFKHPGGLSLPVVPHQRGWIPGPLSMPALIFKAFWPKDSWRFCLKSQDPYREQCGGLKTTRSVDPDPNLWEVEVSWRCWSYSFILFGCKEIVWFSKFGGRKLTAACLVTSPFSISFTKSQGKADCLLHIAQLPARVHSIEHIPYEEIYSHVYTKRCMYTHICILFNTYIRMCMYIYIYVYILLYVYSDPIYIREL